MADLYRVRTTLICESKGHSSDTFLGVEETRYVLDRVRGVHGFFGASSMERLPVETALEQNARRFKDIEIRG